MIITLSKTTIDQYRKAMFESLQGNGVEWMSIQKNWDGIFVDNDQLILMINIFLILKVL